MTPVPFEECNTTYAKDQPQYLSLPAHLSPMDGCVTTCWGLSWKDRLRVLVTGKMWFQQLTFGGALQPQRPSTQKPTIV